MPQLSEGGPYVYPTWLPKLLAGLDRGEWKIWFQVHHDGKTWDKLESDFDLTRYNIEHTELLRLCTEEYKGRGFTVTVSARTTQVASCSRRGRLETGLFPAAPMVKNRALPDVQRDRQGPVAGDKTCRGIGP